jgi:hypothetical protein
VAPRAPKNSSLSSWILVLLSCTGKVFGCIDVLHSFHVVFFFNLVVLHLM